MSLDKWWSIESAPKEKHPPVPILVGAPGYETEKVYWERRWQSSRSDGRWAVGVDGGETVWLGYEPTHWQPLPSPPLAAPEPPQPTDDDEALAATADPGPFVFAAPHPGDPT